jgi:hypothetical protein
VDQPGHESARLLWQQAAWHMIGTAVFAHNRQPCRLDYQVVCDSRWHTVWGRVAGWVGNQVIELDLSVDAARRWWLNGTEYAQVAGCLDLDLNFSLSTNLLPIRRLDLAIRQEAEVRAAWLRFPDFTLELLEQRYHRLSDTIYCYESAGGQFVTELQVNTAGFITRYPNLWEEERDE